MPDFECWLETGEESMSEKTLTPNVVFACMFLRLKQNKQDGILPVFPRRQLLEDIKHLFPDRIHPLAEVHLAHILNEWVGAKYLSRIRGKYYGPAVKFCELEDQYSLLTSQIVLSCKEKKV